MQTHHNSQQQQQHDTKSISDNPEEGQQRKHKPLLFGAKQSSHCRTAPSTNQDLKFIPSGGGCAQLDINNNNDNRSGGDGGDLESTVDKENMGSNVSRHNGKGLSGRRSLSSGESVPLKDFWGTWSQCTYIFKLCDRLLWMMVGGTDGHIPQFLCSCSSRRLSFEPIQCMRCINNS